MSNTGAKIYIFARLYSGSDRTARRQVEALRLGRRQTGRAIRKGRRQIKSFSTMNVMYCSYDEQKRLYEKWQAQGRGTVVMPRSDVNSSHSPRGFAIDTGGMRHPWNFEFKKGSGI